MASTVCLNLPPRNWSVRSSWSFDGRKSTGQRSFCHSGAMGVQGHVMSPWLRKHTDHRPNHVMFQAGNDILPKESLLPFYPILFLGYMIVECCVHTFRLFNGSLSQEPRGRFKLKHETGRLCFCQNETSLEISVGQNWRFLWDALPEFSLALFPTKERLDREYDAYHWMQQIHQKSKKYPFMSVFEEELVRLQDDLRTHPSNYARILEDWLKWYDSETSAVQLPASDLILREGSAVLQDALAWNEYGSVNC